MDNSQRSRIRIWNLPYRYAGAVCLAAFWLPFYDALVHGQISPVLTLLLALGIGRSPAWRGFLVGLTAALKPSCVFMIPALAISFGWRALAGCLAGASLAFFPPHLFLGYLRLLPELSHRVYGDIGLVHVFGVKVCLIGSVLLSLVFARLWHGEERSYMAIITTILLGNALWFHSYTPLIVPAIYGTTRLLDLLEQNQEHSKTNRP